MKKYIRKECTSLLVILVLLTSIACNDYQSLEASMINSNSENKISEESIENEVSEEYVENDSEQNCVQESETVFIFDENNVSNLQEIVEEFPWKEVSALSHECEVGNSMSETTVPQEIIDVLISVNDENADDNLIVDYAAENYTLIEPEDVEEIRNFFGDVPILYIRELDIDYDNEKEYLVLHSEGNKYRAMTLFEYVDGELKESVRFFDHEAYYELLEVNGKYYILLDTTIEYYDEMTGEWDSISIKRKTIEYNVYEYYGMDELSEDIFLQDVDLLNRRDWRQEDTYEYELICGKPQILEKEIDNETYYYVVTDFRPHIRDDRKDELLFVVKREDERYEIVKAYYLAADLELSVE